MNHQIQHGAYIGGTARKSGSPRGFDVFRIVEVRLDRSERGIKPLDVPGLLFRLGSVAPERIRSADAPLPSLHSSQYAPEPELTLRTGIRVTSHMILDLLQ